MEWEGMYCFGSILCYQPVSMCKKLQYRKKALSYILQYLLVSRQDACLNSIMHVEGDAVPPTNTCRVLSNDSTYIRRLEYSPFAGHLGCIRYDRHRQTIAAIGVWVRYRRICIHMASFLPHGQIVLRRRSHGRPQVRRLELWFWRFLRGVSSGPILFSAFVSPISRIMEAHGIKYHQYADDTQIYTEVRSLLDSTQTEALSKCVSALTFWFLDNGLQLNSSKTEATIFGTRPGLSKLGPVSSLVIGGDVRREGKHQNPWWSSWILIQHYPWTIK